MKILIDLYHIPQFNFFKNTILNLDKDEVDLCCINRGRLVKIIQKECPGYNLIVLGDYKHNKGRFSMLFRIMIPRVYALHRMIRRNKYDFVITAHYQANLAAKLNRIPNIALIDDPRKIAFDIDKFSTNELYIPCFSNDIPKTRKFNALKEWAYLSPKYFKPNPEILHVYSLKPKEYIFIREVDTSTSNYLSQDKDIILQQAEKISELPQKIVLSLEKKINKPLYPADWIILEEPVSDIHSLMYYSKLVISSGDSMAREGSMLGVQSIYCGEREMPANHVLIEKGMLTKVLPEKLIDSCREILINDKQFMDQDKFRIKLEKDWEDVTNFLINKIKMYTKQI
ncbi:MAG: DUF354 domain-containing protein [Bacteroidales bacterium]|nr:DUF354 domain-containing protein [Bacteroidales bacterium]